MNSLDAYLILIKKYFKKENTELLLELGLENYDNRTLYFRIDYYKKERVYKLSFIDINHIESNNIRTWVNSCNIEPNSIEHIEKIINSIKYNGKEIKDEKHRVTLNTYFNVTNHITFKRYLPPELSQLTDVLIVIFNNAPKKLEGFFFEIMAKIFDNTQKFEYNDILDFDIYKGDIKKLFNKEIVERGEKYYKDDCVKFVEKVGDKFYAVVDGSEEYVVIIDYDSKNKKMKLFCSCPCEFYCKHLYAVLKCIQNKEEKRFYKLVYVNDKANNYLDRLLEANIFLCTGIERSVIKFINNQGNIEVAPIVDVNGKCPFEVIEDDDKKTISKQLDKLFPKDK